MNCHTRPRHIRNNSENYVEENITRTGGLHAEHGCKIDNHCENGGSGNEHTAVIQCSMYPVAGDKLDHAFAALISSM